MTDTATSASMVNLPVATLAALHRVLAEQRGAAQAAALVRQLGFESGEGFHEAFRLWLDHQGFADPAGLVPDQFWQQLGDFFASLGWGQLRFESLHPGVGSLVSDQWAEADAWGGGARQPTCHFSTGLLADLLGRVAGDDLAVMEVECRTRGDGHCRFVMGGADTLGQLFQALRQGVPLATAVARLS